jgi:hypothetical protein
MRDLWIAAKTQFGPRRSADQARPEYLQQPHSVTRLAASAQFVLDTNGQFPSLAINTYGAVDTNSSNGVQAGMR